MKSSSWLFAAVILACPLSADAEEVYAEQRGAGVLARTVIVPPQQFTRAWAEQASRTFLAANKGSFRVLKLSIFVSGQDTWRATGIGHTEVTYAVWERYYREYGAEPLPMAEAIAIDEAAVLRFRDRSGRVERVVLIGSDPLLLDVEGTRIEILHLRFRTIPKIRQGQEVEPLGACFYVRTEAKLTPEFGIKATGILAARVRLQNVDVFFRKDAWFITAEDFPLVYPFEPQATPPSFGEYYASVTLVCVIEPDLISCSNFGPNTSPPAREPE
jgi:hypothetical protein